ncbi:MAG: hypothetical protein WDN69_21230 [Aliidongia sp.]
MRDEIRIVGKIAADRRVRIGLLGEQRAVDPRQRNPAGRSDIDRIVE